MPKRSAGLLVYRPRGGEQKLATAPGGEPRADTIEVLLVHPGGPYWSSRDNGWWSIPKGEVAQGEDELEAAEREFAEELGMPAPSEPRLPLGEVAQRGGKRVVAWAVAGDLDTSTIDSDTFELEWPPRSGMRQRFPEVDRAAWCTLEQARVKMLPGQLPLLDRLVETLARTR